MPTSICACSNEILHRQLVWEGITPCIRNFFTWLADELVINCTRKSNAKKGIGCMSENPGKVMVRMEGHTMDQRVCQIKHFVRYPL